MLARTVRIAPRLVDEAAGEGGQARGIQRRPQALPQRLGDEQVALAVDLLHRLAGRCQCRRLVARDADVVQAHEHVDDAVEHARDRPRAGLDLTPHLVDAPLQFRVTLAPARVSLTVGARMTGVALQSPAQRLDVVLALRPDAGGRRAVGAIELLDLAELRAQPRILDEVAAVAGHRLRVAGEGLLGILHLAGEAHDGAVGLELRERRLQDLARPLAAELVDEVHCHVVRRAEARVQRIRAAGCQSSDRLRIERLGPLDDGVPLDVDAATPGPSGELGVLPRGDRDTRLAVELLELFEHDGAGGHVDAECERLGREDGLHELAAEQLFDDFFERRQQPRVVRSDAALEVVAPLAEAQHVEIVVGHRAHALIDDLTDLIAFFARRQAQARTAHLLHRPVAAGTAEDEEDRRQQVGALE